MSICVSWSTEHGCTRCRNRRECNELGLSPFDDATDEEVNALVDDGILPEYQKPARTLRKHRQALRLTLEEVGRRAGLSKGFLSQVENGKARLGLDTAGRLAKVMGVSLEELSGMMQRYEKQTERTR